uniref:Uncharacterized protein n=1 Tax=Nocardia terpenica TaxID=455432 RepID=A0A809RD83_9NOCA|nr:hypothetical protein [Nocardia terpenica]
MRFPTDISSIFLCRSHPLFRLLLFFTGAWPIILRRGAECLRSISRHGVDVFLNCPTVYRHDQAVSIPGYAAGMVVQIGNLLGVLGEWRLRVVVWLRSRFVFVTRWVIRRVWGRDVASVGVVLRGRVHLLADLGGLGVRDRVVDNREFGAGRWGPRSLIGTGDMGAIRPLARLAMCSGRGLRRRIGRGDVLVWDLEALVTGEADLRCRGGQGGIGVACWLPVVYSSKVPSVGQVPSWRLLCSAQDRTLIASGAVG